MMYCKWCNKEVDNNSQFCVHCGKALNDLNSSTNFNVNDGNFSNINSNDKVNIGLSILSWFIPLVGFILFLVNKKEKPKMAKSCGLCALISFIINFLTIMIFFIWGFSSILSVANDFSEQVNDYNDSNIIFEDEDEDEVIIDNNGDGNINVSKDWKKYEVAINGNVLVLPLDYQKLSKATGFTYKASDLELYLKSGYYTYLSMYDNNKLALYVDILNVTGNDLLYPDCEITRISQTKYQLSNTDVVVVFPGNLKVGQKISETDIINLFGEPDDIFEYSDDNYNSKTYKYLENSSYTTINKYEITVVNGIIDELELDRRG